MSPGTKDRCLYRGSVIALRPLLLAGLPLAPYYITQHKALICPQRGLVGWRVRGEEFIDTCIQMEVDYPRRRWLKEEPKFKK